MIGIYFKTLKDRKFKKVDSYRAGSWVNVEEATEEDLREIARITGLEYADLQDALDVYEVPRIERQEGKNILVFVRNPKSEDSYLYTEVLTIIFTPKYLVTISPKKNKVISALVDQSTQIATTQKSKLMSKILLRVTHEFTVETKRVRNTVHSFLSEKKKIGTKDIVTLSKSEDVLNQFLSALIPMQHVIEAIRTGKYVSLFEEDEDLLNDLAIGIRQSASICDVNLKSITSARETYQVVFTNNLNRTIKLLTSFTIILTIPTIIASLYGMNVSLPFSENPYAFFMVLGIAATLSLVVLLIFYFEEWL